MEKYLALIVAALHIGFLYLEMFLWKTPKGQKIFGLDNDFAQKSAALAANQGLYNGFLAAGLIWAFFEPQFDFQTKLLYFFFSCVLVAGLYGGKTASKSIYFIQALPAAIALASMYFRSAI